MSTAKENPCRKFQANFFNKSKCQNCFKPRELHLLTDQDLTQAKPIYGGWLCLAPEGTDFDNPMQRSRKWQRRFFVLYEHGCLRFALDESPSTLPQGTVNMNLCTDVIDAEPKTGQKNSLCIITPEQEYYIRGENKEIINGWSDQLVVYPRTNKQNQKKKRKVEPTTSQEPGPAKVPVTGSGIPEAEKVPDSSSIIWQEELNQREAEGAAVWAAADLPPGSPLPPAGDGGSVAPGSDAGSVNGDEVDRSCPVLHGSAPQPPSDLLSPTGSCSSLGGLPRCLSPAPSDPFPSGSSLLSNGSHISGSVSSLDSDASGSTVTSTDSHPAHQRGGHSYSHHDTPRSRRLEAEARKAEKRSRYRSPERQERDTVISPERSRSGVIEKLEALELENQEKMEVEESGRSGVRQGRSEQRRFHREDQRHDPGQGLDFPSTLPPLRRAKSLDRRTTDSVMTPDLLNFKKGWMVKLDEQGQWKKFWFVLTDHSLRYYKDSIAEEASDLDGEIDLSSCYSVTEYQAQRNYGFQIHTQEGVHTLSAMTAGIRRNWIQAVMKNVRPSTAPDVASSTEDHSSFSPLEALVRPDITQDSPSSEASSVEREPALGVPKSRARERRREGRSKTFDWAEFRPIAQALAQQRAQEAESLQAELGELERSRRREERRKRYETVTGSTGDNSSLRDGGRTEYESGEMDSERQQRVEEVIEQHWQQVEKTPIRDERRVPLPVSVQGRETADLEQLLDNYKQGMEELKAQLESCHQQLLDSNKHKQDLELQLRMALEREQDIRTGYISPLEPPMGLEADVTPQMKRPELVSPQAQSLTKKYQETKELLKLQELKKRSMQAQLGLSLSHLDPYFSQPPHSTLEGPPPQLVQKTISFMLTGSTEAVQELEELIADKPLSLKELMDLLMSHSCNKDSSQKHQVHKLLETWRNQQEAENQTLKKSLARAGESIRDYEARLLTMEDLVGKVQKQSFENLKSSYGPLSRIENHPDSKEESVAMLSQRVELLTNENAALKQRCQEIVNQLTEADREIDRLKAELSSQQGGKQVLVLEELKRLKAELADNQATTIDREYYERELNEKSLRLHEALVTLEELGNTLKHTERKLQLREATLRGLGFHTDHQDQDVQPESEQLQRLLDTSRAELSEKEMKLQAKEQQCLDLEARNQEVMRLNQENERVSRERLRDAQDQIRALQERLEMSTGGVREPSEVREKGEVTETREVRELREPSEVRETGEVTETREVRETGKVRETSEVRETGEVTETSEVTETGSEGVEERETQQDDQELIQEVVEEMERRSEAVDQVLEILAQVDVHIEKTFSDLRSTLFSPQSEEPLTLDPEKTRMLLEAEFWSQLLGASRTEPEEDRRNSERHFIKQMMAQNRLMLSFRKICPQEEREDKRGAPFTTVYGRLDRDTNTLVQRELTQMLEEKSRLLQQITSNIRSEREESLQPLSSESYDFIQRQKQPSDYLHDALREACTSYVITKLKAQHHKELEQKQTTVQPVECQNCPKLREAARSLESSETDLQARLFERTLKTTGPQILTQTEGGSAKHTGDQKATENQRKALEEVKDGYELEAEKLRGEIVMAYQTLRLRSEEHKRLMDALTGSMEDLKKKHEQERTELTDRFNQEIEELRGLMSPDQTPHGPASTLKEQIQELLTQVSDMSQEMRRREEQGDVMTLRQKYEKDLDNLKVEALLVLTVVHL